MNPSFPWFHPCTTYTYVFTHKVSRRCIHDRQQTHKNKEMDTYVASLTLVIPHYIMCTQQTYRPSYKYTQTTAAQLHRLAEEKTGKWGRMFLNTEHRMCIWCDLLEQQHTYPHTYTHTHTLTHTLTHCLGRCILNLS